MKKYTTNGRLIACNEGFMGIFSAVEVLNDKCEEVEKLKEALSLVQSIFNHGDFQIETPSERALISLMDKVGYPVKVFKPILRDEEQVTIDLGENCHVDFFVNNRHGQKT